MKRSHRLAGALPLIALVLSLTLSAVPVHAAPKGSPAEATSAGLDRLLSDTYPAGEPGAAVLVEKDGKVLLRKGYGMANLEHGIPIAPETVFEVGSITKQFTAAAVLMLQERGKLSIQDDLTKFLPDYPTQGKKVTIENLLTHTSGIPSYTGLPEWLPRMREDSTEAKLNPEAVAGRIAKAVLGLPTERLAVPIDLKTLDDYVGVYRNETATRTVTREGDKLFAQRQGGAKTELGACAHDEFVYKDGNATIRFLRDGEGRVTGPRSTPRPDPRSCR
jgi:hypothetical protein